MITTLPQNWILKPLKYVDDFVSDSLSETISPGYRFRYVDISSVSSEVGIENYSETTFAESPSRARKRVVAGDTIVSTVRTYLKAIALINDADDVIVSTGFSVIRARDHISDYLYYLCTSDLFCQQVNKYSWGIAYPAISEKLMGRILVPVPPKEEQALIAGFLDEKCASIDATVSILEKQIATLERYRASVIHEAVTKGLNPDAPMKPSGIDWIGDIPEGWDCVRLQHLITRTQNGMTRRGYGESKGSIVLRIKNIQNGEIDYSSVDRIELTSEERANYALKEGDFLFVRVNGSKELVGKCAIFHKEGHEDIAYNDHIIRVTVNDGTIDRKYLFHYLKSDVSHVELRQRLKTSAGQFTVSSFDVKQIRVPLPSLAEQKAIANYLDTRTAAIDAVLETKRKQIDVLKRRRQSLIYEYVTGKRRVGEEM